MLLCLTTNYVKADRHEVERLVVRPDDVLPQVRRVHFVLRLLVAAVAVLGLVAFLRNLEVERLVDVVERLAERERPRVLEVLVQVFSQLPALRCLGQPRAPCRSRRRSLSARLSVAAG